MTKTNSDCGCHDSGAAVKTAPASSLSRQTVFVPRDVAAPAKSATSAGSAQTGVVDLGGFRALNPQDGLFLRGEHLAAIQDYSRALTTAVATASGTGIVHGLELSQTANALTVSPGLAISPRGRLLLLAGAVTVPLDDAHLPALPVDGFWRVELLWASDTSGSAPVYGSLCTDNCADGGATIRQWRDEGVEIRFAPDALPGFDAVAPDLRGNWLSSAYFERERAGGQPWLVPSGQGIPVPSVAAHDWADGTPASDERGVPLGVVYIPERSGGGYSLQEWTARRLVDGPAAHATWQGRLAMRPWSIFLAQILQFEAEILGSVAGWSQPAGAVVLDLGDAYESLRAARELFEGARRFIDDVKPSDHGVRNRDEFKGFMNAWEQASTSPLAKNDPVPVSEYLGIGELPPAGYLPLNENAEDVERRVSGVFGNNVEVRVRRVRADQVAEEILAAQHRDRIPLGAHTPRPAPKIDVLLPTEEADKAELNTAAYGWVAFVRRGPDPVVPPAPEAPTEDVEVYVQEADHLEIGSDLDLDEHQLKELVARLEEDMGPVTFPREAWAYHRSEAGEKTIAFLKKEHDDRGFDPMGVVALTRGPDRVLAALRAGLFTISLDSAYGHLPIRAYADAPLDVIIVLVTHSPY
ncbi:MAG: hypothetical protein ABWY26_11485 [Microbacterium sp.]